MHANNHCVILITLLIGIVLPSHAGNFSKIEILKEENRTYTLTEILGNKDLPYEMFEQGQDKMIRGRKSYWLKFEYTKKEPQKTFYLVLPYILYNKMDIYFYIKDSLYHYHTGISVDYKARNLFLPFLGLELPTVNTPTTCYLHVDSFFNYFFFFGEDEVTTVLETSNKQSMYEFFSIGLSFLAAVFSLIFFLFLKDKMYVFYSVFCVMIIASRLVITGHIFLYANAFVEFDSLKAVFSLFSITTAGINIALLFYFHEFFQSLQTKKRYSRVIYSLAALRVLFMFIDVYNNPMGETAVIFRVYDTTIELLLLILITRTPSINTRLSILAGCSLLLIIIGNVIHILHEFFEATINREQIYLNLATIEVIFYAITMAYRSHFLKKEHDLAVSKAMENLKEKEQLKDQLNKELEIKVEERTKQIRKMNEVLKSHNIELETEVKIANEARVFQKIMDFAAFQKIFPNDEACFKYLSKLKWKQNETTTCKKCGYQNYPGSDNLSVRCGKCGYLESVTTGTVFQNIKFPILKAFYITYRTSTLADESTTNATLSKEIDLRPGTLLIFKKKILSLMEETKTRKKHKDGWTHLIEYSFQK